MNNKKETSILLPRAVIREKADNFLLVDFNVEDLRQMPDYVAVNTVLMAENINNLGNEFFIEETGKFRPLADGCVAEDAEAAINHHECRACSLV